MINKLLPFIISCLAGCLYSLAYPSFLGQGWFPMVFLGLLPLFWLLQKAAFKQSLLIIFCFNMGLNFCGYYWIPHTLREFGQLPIVASYIIGLFSALILQPHWWIYALWQKWRPHYSWDSPKGIIISSLALTLLERFIPQQFPSFVGSPWLHLAPYLGLAPYFGVAIFSFFTYWTCFELLELFNSRRFRPLFWSSLIVFFSFNLLKPLKPILSDKKLSVKIVQANIGNFLKVSSEKGDFDSYEAIEKIYHDLSLSGEKKVDLIIWPETAHSETFYGKNTKLWPIFTEILSKTNSEMVIGGYDQNPSKSPWDMIESVYNSAILLNHQGVKETYHKNILIPFGETLPFGALNKEIVKIIPAISLFAKGEGTPLLETRQGYRFVTPICYEILETDFMRSLLNQWGQNDFIINLTNDSWYGDTAEPHQHLFLSKWRSLEFSLPIIRSTNTGITSVIYPDGTESTRLAINQVGTLEVEVPMMKQESFYQRWGFIPTLILAMFLFSLAWMLEKNGSRP